MIDVITKVFCSFIIGCTITFIIKETRCVNVNIKRIVLSSILISIVIYLSITIRYNLEMSFLKTILTILILKLVFKENTYKTILLTLLGILLILLGDIITSIFINGFITLVEAKTKWYYILPCNLSVCLIALLIIKIPYISARITKLINSAKDKSKVSVIVMFVLTIVVIINLFYNIDVNFSWSEKYIINVLLVFSTIIVIIIFLKDNIEYNVLEEKYDALFEYFSEISESIDDLNLTTHEYKNQIAIVGNYIENKKYNKAKEYINDISNSINKDEKLFVNLTDIPTGGLKGLLYYKVVVAKNQKVEIILDVGKNIKKIFKKLTEDKIKIITRIIGVYIDNAVSGTKNKKVNVEIYNIDNQLYFTISNKVKKDFDINNIGKRGFTTKGKGHGKGIYLANKLISRNKWLNSENGLINDYYISKLIIDTKSIGK